jgi:hypothetical protein
MARKKPLDKLSLDMIQCEKDGYGVHYGAWKATQEAVIPKRKETYIKQGVCEHCGKTFNICGNIRRYCDDRCMDAAARKRKKERLCAANG